jgi:curved DNA-binding protein CbpA
MVLKQQVVDAFEVLGLPPDADQSVASTAYKKLALKHHPDRNYGDSSANKRFQEVNSRVNTRFNVFYSC